MPFYKKRTNYRKKPKYRRKRKNYAMTKRRKSYVPRYRRFKDQTIQFTFENTGLERAYFHYGTEKQNQLTNTFFNGTTGFETLQLIIQNNPAFIKAIDCFRSVRFTNFKVTLIPEKWDAATLVSSATLADGEKPEIHFINDDGTTYQELGTLPIPIDEARDLPKRLYKSRIFDKNMVFNIKPYAKTSVFTNRKYDTASVWQPANTATNAAYWVPIGNLLWGITGAASDPLVNDNFKVKTHIQWTCQFKDPKFT